jgi:hypothetical protein
VKDGGGEKMERRLESAHVPVSRGGISAWREQDVLYPAIWDSVLACGISRPPFPITTPSSTGTTSSLITIQLQEQQFSVHTFMMCHNSLRDFELATRRQITRGRFEEEKWLLRNGVIQFLRVGRIISTYSDNLQRMD